MAPRKTIQWKEQVTVAGQARIAYNIDDVTRKKVKHPVRCPKYERLSSLSKDDVQKLIKYITWKLDYDKLEEVLKDKNFTEKNIKKPDLEIIAAKGLLSGDLDSVKKLFKLCESHGHLADLELTDEYYHDMVRRKKKGMVKYNGLILVSLIRQGNHEAVKFALTKIGGSIKIQDAEIQDGDMIFSSWVDLKEGFELTATERLVEAIPKVKSFNTYFEHETPLTAVLKNRESMKKVDSNSSESMLTLLMQAGADPCEQNYSPFKVAARYGLMAEIDIMLNYLRKVKFANKKPAMGTHLKAIWSALLSYAATENQQEVLDYVRRKVDRPESKTRKRKETSRAPKFGGLVEDSVNKLVKVGAEQNCTYRYRILNGIFNLLNMKQQVEEDEVRKRQMNEGSILLLPEKPSTESQGLKVNDWQRAKGSRLRKNEVVNYDAAYEALSNPKAQGLGAKLNTNINVSAAMNLQSISDNASVGGSSRSLRSYSTTSSQSSNTRNKKKHLVKPASLHLWMVNILNKNDFNGERMGMVLFALGLKFYIGTRPARRRKSGESDIGSTWGMESTMSGAESEAEDEEEKANQSDAASQKTDGSDETKSTFSRTQSDRSIGGGLNKKGQKAGRRRKSTLSNVLEFFKETGGNIGAKILSDSSKMKSKDKVIILQLAADFGSRPIMNELLTLIAPQVDKNLLKCVYLATIGDKQFTHQQLLDKVNSEYDKIVKSFDPSDDNNSPLGRLGQSDYASSSKSLRGIAKQRNDAKTDFIASIEDFFEEYNSFTRVQRNQKEQKNQKKLAIGKGAKGGNAATRTARKSISNAVNGARRMSQSLVDFGKKTLGMSKRQTTSYTGTSNKPKSVMGRLRQSITGDAVKGKSVKEQQLLNQFKNKTKGKKNDLQSKLMNNRANEMMANMKSNSSGDPLEELQLKYSQFLEKILEIACLYGHFKIAEYTMENANVNKEEARKVILDLLKKSVGVRQNKKTTPNTINGLALLLANHLPKELVDFPQFSRELLDEATKEETDSIQNLTVAINSFVQLHKEPFMSLNDMMFVIVRSSDGHKDWMHWPAVLNLVYASLKPSEKDKIDEINGKIKSHKPKLKLTREMTKAVSDCCSTGPRGSFASMGSGSGRPRRKSSMKEFFQKGRNSLTRKTKGKKN